MDLEFAGNDRLFGSNTIDGAWSASLMSTRHPALKTGRRFHRLSAMSALAVLSLGSTSGCTAAAGRIQWWISGHWVADYQSAERLSRESNTGIVILYTNVDLTRDDPMREAVRNEATRGKTGEYVRCVLFRDNEPDRRYVAQYGVDRTPAMILVHADGTYHARVGALSSEGIAQFIAEADPPGLKPKLSPFIPRESTYAWISDFESARQSARESGRSMLVVLDRWATRDWSRLRPMLERREVYVRLADMVHCRPGSLWSSAGSAARELGVRNLPAIVIVEPEGEAHILELPGSYESIVRFAEGIRRDEKQAAAASSTNHKAPADTVAPSGGVSTTASNPQ